MDLVGWERCLSSPSMIGAAPKGQSSGLVVDFSIQPFNRQDPEVFLNLCRIPLAKEEMPLASFRPLSGRFPHVMKKLRYLLQFVSIEHSIP